MLLESSIQNACIISFQYQMLVRGSSEEVKKFKYLGVIITNKCEREAET